jgi:uncharacterized OsmC-like protein
MARRLHRLLIFEVSALEITLQHIQGARFAAEARQHRIVVDQPTEDGATNHGMTPSELFLVALGGCVGQHVAQYLSLRGLPADGLLIRVGADRAVRPLRLDGFRIEIVTPGLTERQLRALEKTLPAGLVHNATLRENAVRITVSAMQSRDIAP